MIPERYKKRYREWEKEFLSTETGRGQWGMYAHNPRLTLTITLSQEKGNGGLTSKYKWNDDGKLVAATITLGPRIDKGYPSPGYYPVINALAPDESYFISGNFLAAAKIAHEFGHLNQMAGEDGALFLLREQLVPIYNKILLSNGYNARDSRLVELARQMGGTPVEVWEDRERWAEGNAMLYLCDKIRKEGLACSILTRIKLNVELYAQSYKELLLQIVQSKSSLS